MGNRSNIGNKSKNETDVVGVPFLIHNKTGTQVGKLFDINYKELKVLLCIVAYGLVGGNKAIGREALLQWIENNPLKRNAWNGPFMGLQRKGFIDQQEGKGNFAASWILTAKGKNTVREYMKQYWIVREKLKKSKPEIESLEEYLKD